MSYFLEAFPQEDSRVMGEVESNLDDSPQVGWFSGGGSLTMKGLAEAGRAVDLLGSVGPIIQDKITGGTDAQDAYFREHDEVFNRAVDYWTPDPRSVHWSGQMVGGVLGGLGQLAATGFNPALFGSIRGVAETETLMREGVDAGTAAAAGGVTGAVSLLDAWVPMFGASIGAKMLIGAAQNVGMGVGERAAINRILESEGYAELAKRYEPLDKAAIATELAMGVVFGGAAHMLDPQTRAKVEDLPQHQRDAILVANQAKHLELDTLPGVPRDADSLNAHTRAMLKATEDLLEDRPVDVSAELRDADFDVTVRDAADAERAAPDLTRDYDNLPQPKLVEQAGDAPAPRESEAKPAPPAPEGQDPDVQAALARVQQEDFDIPVGLDETGAPVTMKASEALKAEPELPPNAFQAAVACFLGS